MANDVIPFKKYNLLEGSDLLPQEIVPRKLSPHDIVFRRNLRDNEWLTTLLTAHPLNTEPQKLFLYHEGKDGNFIEGNYYKYFFERGYEVLENPAPSLLIDAAQELSKDREEHPVEMLVKQENLIALRGLFGLVFEELPTYEEIVNGTPKLSLPYKLSEEFKVNKDLSVSLLEIETLGALPCKTVCNFHTI